MKDKGAPQRTSHFDTDVFIWKNELDGRRKFLIENFDVNADIISFDPSDSGWLSFHGYEDKFIVEIKYKYKEKTKKNSNERRGKILEREEAASSVLMFFMTLNDAEVIIGDIVEQQEKMRNRKSGTLLFFWFWWQVFGVTAGQLAKWFRRCSGLDKILQIIAGKISGS